MKYNHIMLDIETMGTHSNAAIVSIGALEFDLETGKIGDNFYLNIDLQSCLDVGLQVDGNTIMWWLNQSEAAQKSIMEYRTPIKQALESFNAFCTDTYIIWANSTSFDCTILSNAYKKCGLNQPWKYYNERCVRTLEAFAPEIKQQTPRTGTAHNALDDCYYQIAYCSSIWKHLQKQQKQSINTEKLTHILGNFKGGVISADETITLIQNL